MSDWKLAISIAALSLTACSEAKQQEQAVKKAIASQLRDPQSAQFSNIRVMPIVGDDFAVCGEVNAKNAFGGYVGARKFWGTDGRFGHQAFILEPSDETYCELLDRAKANVNAEDKAKNRKN